MLYAKNVYVRFGGLTAVDNVSLHIAPGEIHAIIGPNGAGKATFFNAVSGINKPAEGTIEFKTDNDGLFAFTIDEIRNAGLSIWEMTTDLAASTFESKLFTTEYEERFGSAGKNINYVKFK